jgi:N-acetyl-anhydromuramyl-L-alanine amidase AmpD
MIGAHARHYNAHSIGVCYEGGLDEKGRAADTRTPAQRATLIALLRSLKVDYPDARILGHRDLPNVHKDCPCFDCSEYSNL